MFILSLARIVTERDSDRSKGFGFVTYASEEEARSAIEGLNGKVSNLLTVDHQPCCRMAGVYVVVLAL